MFVVGIDGFAILCQPLLALFFLQGLGQSLLQCCGEVNIQVLGFTEQVTVNTEVGGSFWGLGVVGSEHGHSLLGIHAHMVCAYRFAVKGASNNGFKQFASLTGAG